MYDSLLRVTRMVWGVQVTPGMFATITLATAAFVTTTTLGALAAFLPGRKVRFPRVSFESLCGNSALNSLRAGILGA